MTKKIIALAAGIATLPYVPTAFLGAPRVVFDSREVTGADLLKAIEQRDDDLVKQFATLKVDFSDFKKNTAGLKEHVAELAQQLSEGSLPAGYDEHAGTSLGKQFVESDSFKSFNETPDANRRGYKAQHLVKATITSLTTDAAGSAGAGVQPSRQGLDLLNRRRLTVRDLLPVVPITTGSVEVPVQKAFTNNAAMVAEGAAKPQSDEQLELKTFPARVIAHHVKASRQIIDDIPQLRGMIDSDLIYGLKLKEEQQLLLGDGTGQNLNGMVPQATAYSAPTSIADQNMIDVIGLALLQAALADYDPDGIVQHPSDWLTIRLLKDSTGKYLFGPPGVQVEPRLFGVPVVPTPAMTAHKFLVGQFQRAATIFDRWEARVELGFVNEDFTNNLVTILGEERLAFAVKRPGALIYGDFDVALAQ